MYISYYGLAEPPFQNTTNQRFLWLGEKHKEALAVLQYGILQNKGFVLLTGDVGTGKTTLINALLQDVGDGTLVAGLSDPGVDKIGFLRLVWRLFRIPGKPRRLEEYFILFEKFLRKAYEEDKRVLLVVDEAQKLTGEILEQIRVLSNIETPETKLINIILAGQNELYDKLQDYRFRALRQRINIHYRLDTLSEEETIQYVRHRLRVAGLEKQVFEKKALGLVHRYTKGYPRLINRICDHALLTGYVRGVQTITPEIIKECSREILFPCENANPRSISNFLRKSTRLFRRKRRKNHNRVLERSDIEEDESDHGEFVSKIARFKNIVSRFAFPKKSERNTRRNNQAVAARTDFENESLAYRTPFSPAAGKRLDWMLSAAVLLAILSGFAAILSHAWLFDRWEKSKIARDAADVASANIQSNRPEDSRTKEGSNLARIVASLPASTKNDLDFIRGKSREPNVIIVPARHSEPKARLPEEEKKVLPPPEKPGPLPHRVKWKGETLAYISEWYTGSLYNWRVIAAENPGLDPDIIHVDDEIIIPAELVKTRKPMPKEYLPFFKK